MAGQPLLLREIDGSLERLVKRDVVGAQQVEVAFDAPSREWAAQRSGPAINLYLYSIEEDLARREALYRHSYEEPSAESAARGKRLLLERAVPPRYYKLSYLCTAWTAEPEDEHTLLSQLLNTFLRADVLPDDVLSDELRELGEPIRLTCALPLPKDRSIWDVWSALGGELKPSLDVVVTAPFTTGRTGERGEYVLEDPLVTMAQSEVPGHMADADGFGARRRRGTVEEVVTPSRDGRGRRLVVRDLRRPGTDGAVP